MGTTMEIQVFAEDIPAEILKAAFETLTNFGKDDADTDYIYHELYLQDDGEFGIGTRSHDYEETLEHLQELILSKAPQGTLLVDYFDGDEHITTWLGAKATERELEDAKQELEIAQARIHKLLPASTEDEKWVLADFDDQFFGLMQRYASMNIRREVLNAAVLKNAQRWQSYEEDNTDWLGEDDDADNN